MTIGIAVLGCGRIAGLFHLPIFASLPGCRITALADADPANLDVAGRFAADAVKCRDWRDALEVTGVDAAVICLPPALHAEAAVAALGKGLHVYVEKPLALSAEDGRRMVAAQEAAGRIGMIGFNFRFHPVYAELKRRVDAGAAGDVVALRGLFCSAKRALPGWKQTRESGGGALRELGVHHLDLMAHLAGSEPVAVQAIEASREHEADLSVASIRFRSGTLASLTVSLASGHSVNRIELLGTAGHLAADTADARLPPLETPPGRLARLHRARRRIAAALHPAELLKPPGREPSFEAALRTFVRLCAGETLPHPTLADGRRALELVLALERSAATGERVPVGAG